MTGRTFAEKVLSAKADSAACVGDIVLCEPDLILGTDGSTPMAIDVFEQMGGDSVANPDRILLSRDHYAPPRSNSTIAYHSRMATFATRHGIDLLAVGDGVGFQVAMENGRVRPGDLVVGADSHTLTCGALGAFATGIGSTDLAAALLTGKVWLRIPETIRVVLDGQLPSSVGPKDLALELVRRLGTEGASYAALEFVGPAATSLDAYERSVVCNMAVETGAKIGVFPPDTWRSDEGSRFADMVRIDCATLEPLVALPPDPANSVAVSEVAGTPIDWIFLGSCIGGRADDLLAALEILQRGGGIAEGVTVVVTPSSGAALAALESGGTLRGFEALGAIITEAGCGPCCGTSPPIPPKAARIMATSNRNFIGRMGEESAVIHLASPETCAAAATAGRIVDPREVV